MGGEPIAVCADCRVCVNCEMGFDFVEQTNWIRVKRHNHGSQGWSVEEGHELICDECKTFRCNVCTESVVRGNVEIFGLCTNRCDECGWACDDEECECNS
jgi:hypothetical protein